MHLDVSGGVPLVEELDPEGVIRAIPDVYRRKGLLFGRHVAALGDEFERLRASLEAPPGPSGYELLEEYPTRDYFRIFDRVARRAHPALRSAQAWRLEARNELQSLLGTTLGKVHWSAFSTPREPLLRYAEFAPFVMTHPRGAAHAVSDARVCIEYRDPVVSIAYGLGVFEGVVLAFGKNPRTLVTTEGEVTTFDIRWTL